IIERSNIVNDYRVFRFTALEISIFYKLYSITHKWRKTKIIINGRITEYSPNVTKVFRCCYEASDWPKRQNEWYKKNCRPEKHLDIKHYCYGYDRTIYNIVGCQKIKSARDNYLYVGQEIKAIEDKDKYKDEREGWMNQRFIRINDDKFEVIIDKLKNEIWNEWNNAAHLCPFMVKDRIVRGLDILKDITSASKDFWTIEEDGTLNPKPIEYYFDIDYDKNIGSKSIHEHSLVYFIILSTILGLSFYETVQLIAIEHPPLLFTIGSGDSKNKKIYIKFESIEQLIQKQNLILPPNQQLKLTE
ncbi:MAG: hypothetical protein KKF20_01425, partial [Bacteroidetes bacterium]|nr:hypothetical protein [Bacteroidota bacterium]